MTPDTELLNRYATQRDEAAFAELVRRHLDHVYSTALRLVGGDTHFAEDVAQMVFTDLARKAKSLRRYAALSGWLHTSARFAAAKVVRSEQRRRQREQTALTMPATSVTPASQWEQLRPVLDQAIGELSDADRDALLLRYFEKKPFADIGAALGLSENAARMRVDRAPTSFGETGPARYYLDCCRFGDRFGARSSGGRSGCAGSAGRQQSPRQRRHLLPRGADNRCQTSADCSRGAGRRHRHGAREDKTIAGGRLLL